VSSSGREGLFNGLFGRGAVGTSDRDWLQAMLDTEAALAMAIERAGLASAGTGAAVSAVARADNFDIAEIGRAATLTGSPVAALVRALSAKLPADAREAVHRGATSQDIIDTAVMLLARRAIDAAVTDLVAAAGSAAQLARAHARTVMTGRTLLQQAVPVTFGLVAAGWLTSIDEARSELERIRATRLAIQFGGAAGTLASLGENGPTVAALLADELGLAEPALPWHTDRLRIVQLAAALAGVCAVLGKIARDVTLLAQTEVAEVAEGSDDPRQGGSSAMPHKRNQVASVIILGCAKRAPGLLATLAAAAAESEYQRAAGAWHAEWETLSDLLRLTGSAASWSAKLLTGLTVDTARMRANVDASGGRLLAEHVAAELAPSLGFLAAHDLVAAAASRASERGIGLTAALLDDADAAAALRQAGLGEAELAVAVDPAGYLGASAEFIRRALAAHRAGHIVAEAGHFAADFGYAAPDAVTSEAVGATAVRSGAARSTTVRLPVASSTTTSAKAVTSGKEGPLVNDDERTAVGMRTRRAVLGDEHVDRAAANTTDFTAPFQDFVTRYAWGELWNRPGLSRPERSMITIAMLAALGRDEELALHVRAALRNGLSPDDISEVLLQVGVYAGVPAANRAFAIAAAIIDSYS
jgi:3-carboxy-cis,cis-muconate cycloisomerase